ncbi:hypothetical protein DD238_006374 [Peronospora effusa]|uniref:Stc1 domain-containing protein n=1 Tax=Peronospora effusa TaxID=542832 RepID=A0A3M6VF75_9STRA|nr:hypothetical protein DD238_006374 [Peronospora effusa]
MKQTLGEQKWRICAACGQSLSTKEFSRHQQLKSTSKCKACIEQSKVEGDLQQRLKRCVQCFRNLPKTSYSKRQSQLLDAKCRTCVQELERAATASPAHTTSKFLCMAYNVYWLFDQYYRVCHRGKNGGVSVRVKHNIASPLLGCIPLGRVFCATAPICNEQGDPMVRLEGPYLPSVVSRTEVKMTSKKEDEGERQMKEAWVPYRSLRNEILLEHHQGPFVCNGENGRAGSRFFRCVVEGCKVRKRADLAMSELGYVLYGDVVEVVETLVALDGIVFLRLHDRYFDGAAWVVERSLDNESVMNEVEGPWMSSPSAPKSEQYRCVQVSGAPVRLDPELTASPVGRIPCGALVTVVERAVTDQRQVFLRVADLNTTHTCENDTGGKKWIIETSTCCASVMIKANVL